MYHEGLKKHRDEVYERWFDQVLAGYPKKTGEFLRSQKDPFDNPVAAGLREGLNLMVDGLADGVEPADLQEALDRVIRVRAVQDFSPAEAVGFVFDLKRIVRDVFDDGSNGAPRPDDEEMDDLDRSIDRLGLAAFDVYMSCREEVWAIRAREIRNQSLGIMERVQAWRERRADDEDHHAPRPDASSSDSRG